MAARAAPELMPHTVAERLRADETRTLTLLALERLPPPVPRELALAAAPALTDVSACTDDRTVYERCTLLMARLMAEAAPDPTAVYGNTIGERLVPYLSSRVVVDVAQRALGNGGGGEGGQQPLTRDDAISIACFYAHAPPAFVMAYDIEPPDAETMLNGFVRHM